MSSEKIPVPREPLPLDAIEAIRAAFADRPLVAFAEEHRCEPQHAFIRTLVRHPRISSIVDAIVVEFGNARFQPTVDRYLSGGRVAGAELRRAWLETTQGNVWDAPMYERFFTAVRAVNRSQPGGRGIRVLLGDPPIDWSTIHDHRELEGWYGRRNAHFAAVVEDEVLRPGRRALLIAGGFHLFHRQPHNETARLERRHGDCVFVVLPQGQSTATFTAYQPRMASWPAPALALLPGTWLGSLPVSVLGRIEPSPGTGGPPRLADWADAYLYLGIGRPRAQQPAWAPPDCATSAGGLEGWSARNPAGDTLGHVTPAAERDHPRAARRYAAGFVPTALRPHPTKSTVNLFREAL
jgi:hypothetical protein